MDPASGESCKFPLRDQADDPSKSAENGRRAIAADEKSDSTRHPPQASGARCRRKDEQVREERHRLLER